MIDENDQERTTSFITVEKRHYEGDCVMCVPKTFLWKNHLYINTYRMSLKYVNILLESVLIIFDTEY